MKKKWRISWTRGSGFNLGVELSGGGNSSSNGGNNNSGNSINQTHETIEDTTTVATHNHRSTQASIDQKPSGNIDQTKPPPTPT